MGAGSLSLATIEGLRHSSLYASTGGGWSPATDTAIRAIAARPDVLLVAATDSNPQGDIFGTCIRAIATESGADHERLRSSRGDWNEDLQAERRAVE